MKKKFCLYRDMLFIGILVMIFSNELVKFFLILLKAVVFILVRRFLNKLNYNNIRIVN